MRRPPTELVALLAALALLGACEIGGGDRGPGEPCTRDRDCDDGLECLGGVCADPEGDGGRGAR